MKPANPHGGAGRGQGRKPLGDAPMVVVPLRMSPKQKAKLAQLGGAAWVRGKIDQANSSKKSPVNQSLTTYAEPTNASTPPQK